jgi:polyphosphate kinase
VAPVPAPVPAPPPPVVIPSLDDSSLYIHRELSQLKFNIRVLEQALDESYP